MTDAALSDSCSPRDLNRCASCGLDLPLRPPRPGFPGRRWTCTGCGSTYEGVLAERCSRRVIRHVRPSGIHFERANLRHPPEAVANFLRKILDEASYEGPERRQSARRELVAPVVAMPMDELLVPTGEAFVALLRNISTSGIALVGTTPVNSAFLAVELGAPDGESLQLLVQVLRCRPLHRFYEIAGPFLAKMDPMPGSEQG